MQKQDLSKVPQELLDLASWTPVAGKKPLLKNWNEKPMSVSDALAYPGSDGVGFVFRKEHGYVGVDLDKCVDKHGQLKPWARDIFESQDSYSEISQSGTGIHIIVKGEKPRSDCRSGNIEVYDSNRQFVLTGNCVDICQSIVESQYWLDWLYETCFPSSYPTVDLHTPSGDAFRRAQAYIHAMPDSVQGENGSTALFRVALKLVREFALPEHECWRLINEYNDTKCAPRWSEKGLRRKLEQAREKGRAEVGKKLNEAPLYHYVDGELIDDESLSISECVERFHNELESGAYSRVSTGIRDLDYALKGGIRPGELVVIQGRPSHGKTAVAIHIQESFAKAGYNSLLISREMSASNIGQRIMQRLCGQEIVRKDLNLSRQTWSAMPEYLNCIRVSDKATDIDSVLAIARKAREEHGCTVVFVDYLQLLFSGGKGSSYEKATEVSQKLMHLKQEGMTVIVLSQMSRGIENREHFTPKASDARDSGQIEQDADVHITVVWDCKCQDKDGQIVFPDAELTDYTMFVHKSRQSGVAKDVIHCRFNPLSQIYDEPEVFHEFDDYSPTQQVLGIDEEV